MLMGGQLGHGLACPEDPGRFYGRESVTRQGQTPIFQEKKLSGQEVGLAWGHKVDDHMSWGALSGLPPNPPVAGSREGVFGIWWWFPCPSGD
jgi:hypothetical protein